MTNKNVIYNYSLFMKLSYTEVNELADYLTWFESRFLKINISTNIMKFKYVLGIQVWV